MSATAPATVDGAGGEPGPVLLSSDVAPTKPRNCDSSFATIPVPAGGVVGVLMAGGDTMAGTFARVAVATGVDVCVAVDGAAACGFIGLSVTACAGARLVEVEPVKVEPAVTVSGVTVEARWPVAGCVEPVGVGDGVLAVFVVAPVAVVMVTELVVTLEVLLLDRVGAVEVVFGSSPEPLEPVLPEVAALDPALVEPCIERVAALVPPLEPAEAAEPLPWLLPPADDVEPPAWEVSA